MPSTKTSKKTPRFNHGAAAHQPFRWLADGARHVQEAMKDAAE